MPPRRRTSGLDAAAVDLLRERLATGSRPPRVAVSGPQFEPGTTGAVVRVGDPAVDGEDFVTVRVKTGSVTDELTFAPAELTLPGRAGAKGTAAPPARNAPPARTAPSEKVSPAATSTSTKASTATRASTATKASTATTPSPRKTSTTRSAADRSTRPRRGPAQKVTITVASDGPQWSVSAQRGARAVVRKQPLTPGAVSALAELVGDEALSEAVAAINDSSREQAESRAAALRAELAELDAVLAAHRRPGRR